MNPITEDIGDMMRETFTSEELVSALVHTYEKTIAERRSKGSGWSGMTRKDYTRHRRPGDPSYRQVERILGSWAAFTGLLPTTDKREKIPGELKNANTLRGVLDEMGGIIQKPGWEITSREFRILRSMVHSVNVYDWRTYARAMGTSTWEETRSAAYTRTWRAPYSA